MSSSQSASSGALVRKRDDTQLMAPPPPVKKIKRPRKVLDEQSYTETLSHIIARDFFPGLLENETKQEYLDALDSKDSAWIASAGRRLQHVMTPGRDRGDETPRDYRGETPASQTPVPHGLPPSAPSKVLTNMSLSAFQSNYTSEDNESFYKLVDKQNQKKADKYAWLWRGNKLPSKQMIKQKEVEDQIRLTRSLEDDGFKKDRLAIKDADDRPAQPDTWVSNPRNGLMFNPDDPNNDGQSSTKNAEEDLNMVAKTIVYENTRMPEPGLIRRPPSPTASSIRDAVAGKPGSKYQDSGLNDGGETPRVNGYSFVKDENDEEPAADPLPQIDLGPGDEHSPFRIQEQRDRETLHERMVDRISKSKKESLKHGFTGRVERTPAPKFPSSPRVTGGLTPAAQRLWSKIGTPKSNSGGGSFGQVASTPRSSRLKTATRPDPAT